MPHLRVLLELLVFTLISASYPLLIARADELALGPAKARAGAIAAVPVVLTDTLGTPLGADAGAAGQIQALAFQARWSPESAVLEATCERSGTAADLTPLFEHSTYVGSAAGYVSSYDSATQPLRGLFPKGAEVARLRLLISPSARPGSTITLSFVPDRTFLSNQDGSAYEHEPAGNLTLSVGTIKVSKAPPLPVLTLTTLNSTVKEGKTARFSITTATKLKKSIVVGLRYSGSAEAGKDFRKVNRVTIAAGKKAAVLRIKVKKDKRDEPLKSLTLSVKNSRAYSIVSPNSASIVIAD